MGWWRRLLGMRGAQGSTHPSPEPGDGESGFPGDFSPPGDGESEEEEPEEEFPSILCVMLWRICLGRVCVVVGVTEELGDGERIWFRVRSDERGDRLSRAPVVAEVRTSQRAHERASTATEMCSGRGWRVMDGPRTVEVPVPALTAVDVLAGRPLADWSADLARRFTIGEL